MFLASGGGVNPTIGLILPQLDWAETKNSATSLVFPQQACSKKINKRGTYD
jgi:hypothetical protein